MIGERCKGSRYFEVGHGGSVFMTVWLGYDGILTINLESSMLLASKQSTSGTNKGAPARGWHKN
jgi:hypothetical protein